MLTDVNIQSLSRFQKGNAGGFRRLIGLLKVFLVAGSESSGRVNIDLCIGPQATVENLVF